ncbi:MAG TPA: histidine kinase [Puia sp.]|nr:histidine kinase [Puia sp.]
MLFNPCVRFIILVALLSISGAAGAQANKLKDSLQAALGHAKNDTSKCKILFALGNFYAADDSAAAIKYAGECRKLAEQRNWPKGLGLYYLLMAKIYRNASDNNACLQNARNAYLVLGKTDDRKNTAAALIYMGNSYRSTGFFAKSIENNLAALQIYEGLDNPHGISLCYNNIGVDYFYLLEYDKAIENYQKALALRKIEGDKFGIGSDLDNIAMVYLDLARYDSADSYNQAGIKMFEAVDNKEGLGRIYGNRGIIMLRMHDAVSAETYTRRSLAIDEKLGFDGGISYALGFIGEIYLALAKDSSSSYRVASFMKKDKKTLLDSAAFYVENSLAPASKAADLNLLMSQHQLLAEIEECRGHYQKALASHKAYTLYKDSIFNDENKQKIASMESERLTQTKNQEIALQAAETKRQALLKNAYLLAAVTIVVFIFLFALAYNRRKRSNFENKVMEVEMKALRAQMNPHFVSNALHSINNYVMENDRQNASAYLAKFASLMRLILENSREREVPLAQDLNALELYMQMELLRFGNSFTYRIEIDPEIDPENILVPPMLLQPFAENAILHGLRNKENGLISIQVRKQNDMICYVIEDNGNGYIESASRAHAVTPAHKSLGRKIINERLSIINRLKKAKATVHISQVTDADNQPDGTRVELFLPVELAF